MEFVQKLTLQSTRSLRSSQNQHRGGFAMTKRACSVWLRHVSVVAVVGCLILASLTACTLTAPSRHPLPTRESVASPEAQRPWVAPEYIDWLERQSMLDQSGPLMRQVSGHGMQWRHEYASPQPQTVVQKASVWVLGYPGSVITRPGTIGHRHLGRSGSLAGIRRDRHRPASHRARQALRGHRPQGIHADHRRLVRPDLARDRSGTGHRGRVPSHGRGGSRDRAA